MLPADYYSVSRQIFTGWQAVPRGYRPSSLCSLTGDTAAVSGVCSVGGGADTSWVTVTIGRRCGYLQLDVLLWRIEPPPLRRRSVDDERRSGALSLRAPGPPCCCCCCWWWTGVVRWCGSCGCSWAARLKYASKSSLMYEVSITSLSPSPATLSVIAQLSPTTARVARRAWTTIVLTGALSMGINYAGRIKNANSLD